MSTAPAIPTTARTSLVRAKSMGAVAGVVASLMRHCCVARSDPARDWCDDVVSDFRVRWFPVSS